MVVRDHPSKKEKPTLVQEIYCYALYSISFSQKSLVLMDPESLNIYRKGV